jgi:GT2 family glycosyltransferase
MSELETPVEIEVKPEEATPSYAVPWISCVVPTYGAKGVELTRNCVSTLLKTHAHVPPEIIVVSDGDNDEIMDALKVIALEFNIGLARIERKGFAAACNAGIRLANGQLAVFLVNNDVEFEVPCLQVMTDAMLSMHAGIVGCRLLYPNRTIQHAGVAFVPVTGQPIPGYFDHILRNEFENHIDAVVMHHGLVTGALLGIGRDFIDRSGYLDERFPFTAEDIDLCLRAIECGLPPLYVGYTYAIHREGASRGRTLEEKMLLEPEVAQKESESLQFLFRKWINFDFNQFSTRNQMPLIQG